MVSRLFQYTLPAFDIRETLKKRARFYTTSPEQQTRIVEKTILLAGNDPDLMLDATIETAMFSLLHEVACQELHADTEKKSSKLKEARSAKLHGSDPLMKPNLVEFAEQIDVDELELLTDLVMLWCQRHDRKPEELLPKCGIILQSYCNAIATVNATLNSCFVTFEALPQGRRIVTRMGGKPLGVPWSVAE